MGPPQIPVGLGRRDEERSGGIHGEGGTVWENGRSKLATTFVLIPKNVTNERPIALVPSIRWWEALGGARGGLMA